MRTVYHNIKNENTYAIYAGVLNLQRLNGVLALQQAEQANSYVTAEAEAVFGNYIRRCHMYELKRNLAKANYYFVLVDGSTDKVIVK